MVELTREENKDETETVDRESEMKDSDTEWLGDVKKEGAWCAEIKQLIRESEDRLKAFWEEEAEKIRREMTPLPCRCESMNRIVGELVAEAEQWRMMRMKEMIKWREEKEELEKVIESLSEERRWAEESNDRTSLASRNSRRSDINNNERVEAEREVQPNRKMGSVVRERREHAGATTDEGSERVAPAGQIDERRRQTNERSERAAPAGQIDESRRQSTGIQAKPEALSESEWKWEYTERRKRKRNIVVRGVRAAGNDRGIAREVKQLLEEKLRVVPKIVRVQRVGGGPVVTLLSMETKKAIMKRKGELGNAAIWIEDDYTTREREVEEWLKREAEKKRREGKIVRRGYMKICVNGVWWQWVEREGNLEKFFRRERGRRT